MKASARLRARPRQPIRTRQADGRCWQGQIEVIITPDGKVRSTRVVGGHPLLVQACQDAVKEWKFFPAPEETTQVIEFDFRGSN